MGKCKCGKDTGFFGGKECSQCSENNKFHYLDKIFVRGGFYKGQKGKVAAEFWMGECGYYEYRINLDKGPTVDIYESYLEKSN